jgi:hypothetical protein
MADLAHEGNYLVTFVPGEEGIAAKAAPTTTELGTGIDLEPRITPTGVTREPSTDRKDTSKLNSTFGTQSTGRRNFNLSIQFVREVDDTSGLETALVYKALGFLVIRDDLPASTAYAAAQPVEVYPVQVDQPQKSSPAANEDQMITLGFAMRDEPALGAVVAA